MRATSILVFSFLLALPVAAQDAPQRPRDGGPGLDFRNMDRVMGTIVSINGDTIVLKPESGEDVAVKIGAETRIRKDREEAKLGDFKPGDTVFAAGKLNSDKSLSAMTLGKGQGSLSGGRFVMRDREGANRMGTMGQPPSPEQLQKMGLGAKFIAGEVKSIDETKLTILRSDGQTQTIEVDENTSFRARRDQSVTLADIKVGDHVAGRGEMKDGVFVPQVLRVGGAPMKMTRDDTSHPVPEPHEPK